MCKSKFINTFTFLFVGLFFCGCCSNERVWSYKLTCASWAVVGGDYAEAMGEVEANTEEEKIAYGVLAAFWFVIMGVPFTLDTALLPITLPHDLIVN